MWLLKTVQILAEKEMSFAILLRKHCRNRGDELSWEEKVLYLTFKNMDKRPGWKVSQICTTNFF